MVNRESGSKVRYPSWTVLPFPDDQPYRGFGSKCSIFIPQKSRCVVNSLVYKVSRKTVHDRGFKCQKSPGRVTIQEG